MAEQPTRRRSARSVAANNGAYLPPAYELADVSAIQAVEKGSASPEQQKRALRWIVHKACGTYDMPFRPGGQDGERETNLALGRMFVGQQIVKMLHLIPSQLPRTEPRADPPEPKE